MENVIDLSNRRRKTTPQDELDYRDPAELLADVARKRATGLQSGNLALMLESINAGISTQHTETDSNPEVS